jgi:threonine dehydrogenase-like Zn-dependent dehydrogenase|uniref:Alcohol dehydrogenase-like N-terminal domain-containing protein n=1 Tax=Globisporangium ultimum (strain ATCC 200006 / CBS 805.95 / DAOM BR144) TaxID=431595 RepID=K3XAF4_GLOUD
MEYVKKFTGGGHESTPPAPEGQMKAITWHGSKTIKVEHVPKPKIEHGSDVIVRVTAASICPGFATQACAEDIPGMEKGQILGREAVGIVESVGRDVSNLKEGDRVAISFVIACGDCSFCRRHEFSACNKTNESREFAEMYGGWAPAAIFGYSRMMGNVPGSQAEFVRVPFGDVNCYKVPNGVPDEKAVFVGETVASALHATEMGEVNSGDTVVIWGLGPVGMMAAQWCKLKGAKRIIGVEQLHDRLRFAYDKLNLEVVDRTGLSSAQVTNKLIGMLPDGGADVSIFACGLSCSHGWMAKMGMEKESPDVLKECFMVTRKFGHVSIISDFTGKVNEFPLGHVMMKHLSVRAGQCPVPKYFKTAFDAIDAGEVDPSIMITHRIGLDEVPEAYMHLCNRDEGYLKVLVRPNQA